MAAILKMQAIRRAIVRSVLHSLKLSAKENVLAAIAIVAGPENGDLVLTAPCGVCRQVMMEFCDYETFPIILGTSPKDYKIMTLKEILPLGFGPKNLNIEL